MSRKIVLFFPHNPIPPRTGTHKRCLEMIGALKESGCRITFTSSTLTSEVPWTARQIADLQGFGVDDVAIHVPSSFDGTLLRILGKIYRIFGREIPINSRAFAPPGMTQWFSRALHRYQPDVILINYAYWDRLVSHRRYASVTRVIETHDLVSLNRRMQKALFKHLPDKEICGATAEKEILDEDFFRKQGLVTDKREFRIYNRYDHTIAISAREASIIEENTSNTRVWLVPMTCEVCDDSNDYMGQALFPMGPNPFNIQGYLYFLNRVLPMVLENAPDFVLQITGSFWNNVTLQRERGIEVRGFVPDFEGVLKTTRFLVCPVLGGTGQQVKIVEAMAHGIPVVATRWAAEASPMENGVTGFVCRDAEEFGESVVRLWKDRELCRKFGEAAREKIRKGFSRERLVEKVKAMID